MGVIMTTEHDDFKIEYMDSKSSEVDFIDGTLSPMTTLAKLVNGYKGIYSNNVSLEEIDALIKDLNSTKLQTPYEMISFVLLLTNVSRAFTHQLVRTRHAAYIQESMRFLGHKNVYRVLVPRNIAKNDQALAVYEKACSEGIYSYEELLGMGVSSEDARGTLPTNILTKVFVGIPLSSLQRIYTQRLCCQAQEEWYHVVKQIKKCLIEEYGNCVHNWLSAPVERGEPCGYNSSLDRPCIWNNGEEKER